MACRRGRLSRLESLQPGEISHRIPARALMAKSFYFPAQGARPASARPAAGLQKSHRVFSERERLEPIIGTRPFSLLRAGVTRLDSCPTPVRVRARQNFCVKMQHG